MSLKIVTGVLSVLVGLFFGGVFADISQTAFIGFLGFLTGVLFIWWIYLLVDKAVKK